MSGFKTCKEEKLLLLIKSEFQNILCIAKFSHNPQSCYAGELYPVKKGYKSKTGCI
jgi:hypothetical protein